MKPFRNGLLTGFILQLGIGPVFFYVMNLTLQKTVFDGVIGSIGVMLGDYVYIVLSILGVSKLLENKRVERNFAFISSVVLIIFGVVMITKGLHSGFSTSANAMTPNLLSSFVTCFLLTVSGPLSIILFTSIFTTKAAEYNYTGKDIVKFGIGIGLPTFIFMASSSIIFSLVKGAIPILLIQILNIVVGFVMVGYGGSRIIRLLRKSYRG